MQGIWVLQSSMSLYQHFSHNVNIWVTSMEINSLQSQCLFWIRFGWTISMKVVVITNAIFKQSRLINGAKVPKVCWWTTTIIIQFPCDALHFCSFVLMLTQNEWRGKFCNLHIQIEICQLTNAILILAYACVILDY